MCWCVVDVMPMCLWVSVRLCLIIIWVEIFTFHNFHFWRGPFVRWMQPTAPMAAPSCTGMYGCPAASSIQSPDAEAGWATAGRLVCWCWHHCHSNFQNNDPTHRSPVTTGPTTRAGVAGFRAHQGDTYTPVCPWLMTSGEFVVVAL
jgi:hypothetical protein